LHKNINRILLSLLFICR